MASTMLFCPICTHACYERRERLPYNNPALARILLDSKHMLNLDSAPAWNYGEDVQSWVLTKTPEDWLDEAFAAIESGDEMECG